MTHESFIERSKQAVVDYLNGKGIESDTSDIYVVWSVKVIQNSKALLSTDLVSGIYVEATMHGDKSEIYVDVYDKVTKITLDTTH